MDDQIKLSVPLFTQKRLFSIYCWPHRECSGEFNTLGFSLIPHVKCSPTGQLSVSAQALGFLPCPFAPAAPSVSEASHHCCLLKSCSSFCAHLPCPTPMLGPGPVGGGHWALPCHLREQLQPEALMGTNHLSGPSQCMLPHGTMEALPLKSARPRPLSSQSSLHPRTRSPFRFNPVSTRFHRMGKTTGPLFNLSSGIY